MKPISVSTTSSSSKRVGDVLDAAASSRKQVAGSLSTAQYLSSTLGESFYLLPQSIIVGKPVGAHYPHFVPTPENSLMCKITTTPKMPTLAGETMLSTKEKKFFSRTARHILPESWSKRGNNNNSTHIIEKNCSGGGETTDQVKGGGSGVDHYTTTDTRLNDDTSAEVINNGSCVCVYFFCSVYVELNEMTWIFLLSSVCD